MVKCPMSKEVDSLDIDGLLVTRPVPIQGDSLWRYARKGVAMYDRILSIPDVDRTVQAVHKLSLIHIYLPLLPTH